MAQVGAGAGFGEERVVAAPDDQRGGLVVVQPLLPCRVELEVGVIVERQGDLGVLAARLVQEVLVEGPSIGRDELWRTGSALVLAAGDGQLEDLADVLLGARARRNEQLLAIEPLA